MKRSRSLGGESSLYAPSSIGSGGRVTSVSNLADREIFERSNSPMDTIIVTRNRETLPKELESREGWTVQTEPAYLDICTAIVTDNFNKVVKYAKEICEMNSRLTGFYVKIVTRANVSITCRNMHIGNLLCLCGSPRVMIFLEQEGHLNRAMFHKKVNLKIDFTDVHPSIVFDGAHYHRLENWNSVPSMHLATLRDSFDGIDWLIKREYLRKFSDTDGYGRNIIHMCVELESADLLKRLFSQEHRYINFESLEALCKQKDQEGDTPFVAATKQVTPAILISLLRVLPIPFLIGEYDITGCSMSLVNALISLISDAGISFQLIQLVLRRGATIDTSYYDKVPSLLTAITSPYYSGQELTDLVSLLIKSGSILSLSSMTSLLGCKTRSENEIIDLAHSMLEEGGQKVLIDPYAAEMKELGDDTVEDMENNLLVKMLNNPQIDTKVIMHLIDLFTEYMDIGKLFPKPEQLANVIVQGISRELKIEKTENHEENDCAFTSLNPEQVTSILRTLNEYTNSMQAEAITKIRFHDKVYHALMSALFKHTPLDSSQYSKEKVAKMLAGYLKAISDSGFDINSSVKGKISMFSIANENIPGYFLISLLKAVPSNFNINVKDKYSESIASVIIQAYPTKFKIIHNCFKILESKEANLSSLVRKNETLFMVYVDVCGKALKEMEISNKINEEIFNQFMELFTHLMKDCKINIFHSKLAKNREDNDIKLNVLAYALSIGLSPAIRELVTRFPKLLSEVPPSVVVEALTNNSEILEFLTSKTLCRASATINVNGGIKMINECVNDCFIGDEEILDSSGSTSNLPSVYNVWVNYCTTYHNDLLEINENVEPDDPWRGTLPLIYDYFQDCEMQTVEDSESKTIISVTMDHNVFRSECDTGQDVINKVLLSTIADNIPLRAHPFISEYRDKYYMRAFFIAICMNLFHLAIVSLFSGHMTWVFTNDHKSLEYFSGFGLNRNIMGHHVSGFYECRYDTCYTASQNFMIEEANTDCTPSGTEGCNVCSARFLNLSACINGTAIFSFCPFPHTSGNFWINPTQQILFIICLYSFVKEVVLAIAYWKVFIKDLFIQLLEMVMYGGIVCSTICFVDCPMFSGFRHTWQYTLGMISLYITWSMLFFYMSRFQVFSTYVIMFYKTVKTGFWLLIAFMPIIMAYTFVFYLLLSNKYSFRNPWVSFIKTINMMIGDTSYGDIFESNFIPLDSSYTKLDHLIIYNENVVRLVHICFIITMVIVLMNLFIGLMVGDVEAINRAAEVNTWYNSLEFIVDAYTIIQWYRQMKNLCLRCCCRSKIKNDTQREEKFCNKNMYVLKLDSFKKKSFVCNILGSVDKNNLITSLLASEKRKRKVKQTVNNLHVQYPYLYCLYESYYTSDDEALFSGDSRKHEHRSHFGDQRGTFAVDNEDHQQRLWAKLALPEDIDNEDPQIKIQRDKNLAYPNKLNRLYPNRHGQHRLEDISINMYHTHASQITVPSVESRI